VIEILILYFNREEFNEILRKLPHKFSSEDVQKFHLKSSISRTKIFYTTIGTIGAVTTIYYQTQNFFAAKFLMDLKFPFDISHPIAFHAMNLDFLIILLLASFYFVVCPIFKFGLIFITSVEFMKLREEFRNLKKEVKIFWV
jgi:hypothetical protein